VIYVSGGLTFLRSCVTKVLETVLGGVASAMSWMKRLLVCSTVVLLACGCSLAPEEEPEAPPRPETPAVSFPAAGGEATSSKYRLRFTLGSPVAKGPAKSSSHKLQPGAALPGGGAAGRAEP